MNCFWELGFLEIINHNSLPALETYVSHRYPTIMMNNIKNIILKI